MNPLTRRQAIATLGAIASAASAGDGQAQNITPQSPGALEKGALERNDAAVARLLAQQVTDDANPYLGSFPDRFGLHAPGSAAGAIQTFAASFVHPQSKYRADGAVMQRIGAAVSYLERSQSPEGNIDLPTTNFNSPPDTAFAVNHVASAAAIGQKHGVPEISAVLRTFLAKAGNALSSGGVHTPNHRWVVCAALAQLNEIFPNSSYVRRIEEWLGESVDTDADGQFIERSTLVYDIICDRSFVVMAAKLGRPELLEPARANLQNLAYLLHANGEVESGVSSRQDRDTRGNAAGYWFPLAYLAQHDSNKDFAAIATLLGPEHSSLADFLEYPELLRPSPPLTLLPVDFEKYFPASEMVRVRRAALSGTVILRGSSRVFAMQYGDAAITGVRFASAFFGKGQFVPEQFEKRGKVWYMRQILEAPYYQPLDKQVTRENWAATRAQRRQTQVCKLEQTLEVSESKGGFSLRFRAAGTNNVPVAIEIGFREGGQLEGCTTAPAKPGMLLGSGTGTFRGGKNSIRFGSGAAPHQYTQLRGAEAPLAGQSVYITGVTPFDHTVVLEGA